MPQSCADSPDLFEHDLNHQYLRFRRTKIVATVGPASNTDAMLRTLVKKGVNVFRINFSHGEAADHLKTIKRIRSAAHSAGTSVAILGDLCGPKIRVGAFPEGGVQLRDGSTVTITTKTVEGTAVLIPSRYKGIVREATVGHHVLLDDGNLELVITKKLADCLEARVVRGGVLKSNKGMNLPDTVMKISALTEKDRSDVLYCIKGQVDYVALSFVRCGKDITDLRRHMARHGGDIPIIAKIEKPEALENIVEIIELADGIMVARGDLGVELPAKKVPIIQSKLIQITNRMKKPVIVATQMLESMIEHGRPTRAEVTDVSSACLGGADAVMLSAETAAGKFPVQAVEMMDSILRETEAYQFFSFGGRFRERDGAVACDDMQSAISHAAAQLSRDLQVRCLFVLTRTGQTARIVSSDRPAAPVIALTSIEPVFRRLNLLWGVVPQLISGELTTPQYLALGEKIIKGLKLANKGDYTLMLSSVNPGHVATDSIVVHKIA